MSNQQADKSATTEVGWPWWMLTEKEGKYGESMKRAWIRENKYTMAKRTTRDTSWVWWLMPERGGLAGKAHRRVSRKSIFSKLRL
jgi:hypothetical protein